MTLKTKLAAQVMDAYRRYLDAFNSDDMDTLNRLVRFPLYDISESGVTVMDSFPVRPSELRKRTGWHETVDTDYEVVGISETKAHLILRTGSRMRVDGSLIEKVHAFYAWTLTPEGWQIFAISGITEPAERGFS